MQDVEFTVERDALYMLQTRSGKRTAAAALKIARDMAEEGQISREEALLRVDPGQLEQLLHPRMDPVAEVEVLCTGLGASPGAATGKIVLTAQEAAERGGAGEAVILVRKETDPDDVEGMMSAKGGLPAPGGRATHTAVGAPGRGTRRGGAGRAARGWGRGGWANRRLPGARSSTRTPRGAKCAWTARP